MQEEFTTDELKAPLNKLILSALCHGLINHHILAIWHHVGELLTKLLNLYDQHKDITQPLVNAYNAGSKINRTS